MRVGLTQSFNEGSSPGTIYVIQLITLLKKDFKRIDKLNIRINN